MKLKLFAFASGVALACNVSAGVFTIGGFKFDERNTVTSASVKDSETDPLRSHASRVFGRFSQEYVTNPATRENEFAKFDRSKSIGRLLGHHNTKGHDYSLYISMPDIKESPPAPNTNRCLLTLTWAEGQGLKNTAGNDFVIYEAGTWEGFAVAVKKAGSNDFSGFRYQFPNSKDSIHEANAVAFDLSHFGLAEGEMITAIQIRNLYSSKAATGADKVDNASGQGNVIAGGEPGYENASVLRQKPGGEPFNETGLSADTVYVTALHDIEPVKIPEPEPTPVVPPTKKAPHPKTNAVAPKK